MFLAHFAGNYNQCASGIKALEDASHGCSRCRSWGAQLSIIFWKSSALLARIPAPANRIRRTPYERPYNREVLLLRGSRCLGNGLILLAGSRMSLLSRVIA